jgi:pimeloyl-ACP methyl ester carboxylesterase
MERIASFQGSTLRESVRFLEPAPRRFVAVSGPESAPIAGVVICSPLWAEQMNNYRREVLLGLSLAHHGIVAARFHYQGTGHSGGDPSTVDVETLRDDALDVAAHLRSSFGVERIAFVGTRLGALIAAMAAAELPESAVAMWDVVANPQSYFRDVLRARLLADLRSGGGARGNRTICLLKFAIQVRRRCSGTESSAECIKVSWRILW